MPLNRWLLSSAACLALAAASFGVEPAASAAAIALFQNPSYVDMESNNDGPCEAEGENLQAVFESFPGHTVAGFPGFTSLDFSAALVGKNVLAIPELEEGNFGITISEEAREVIVNFVEGGGSIFVFYDLGSEFLNDVFGLSLQNASSGEADKTAEAAGTVFADGPASLPTNNATSAILATSLPDGSINVYNYNDGSNDNSVVAVIPIGEGQAVFFGWDWYGSEPPGGPGDDCSGGQDGGWNEVLEAALPEGAPPTPTPVPTDSPDDDSDGDGVVDADDNCPDDDNADQADGDGDGVGDACDDLDGEDLDGGGCSLQAGGSAPAGLGFGGLMLVAGAAWALRKRAAQ